MLAAIAARFSPDDPLSALELADMPDPTLPDGSWTTVALRAASINHHDLWTLRGVGIKEDQLPMILGCDGAGIDEEGNEVIVHSVIGDPSWHGDETLDPKRSLLSERYPGTFAERVAVPRWNLVPKPADLSWAEAACLPTTWLTAYRMLFTMSGLQPGQTILVQGAGGGVATALIVLASRVGLRVWATSRNAGKRDAARDLGAAETFESGQRLPEQVDAVMETVGAATWSHSVKSLKPGGAIVICGATTGPNPESALLNWIFFRQLRVLGSTMGTRQELERLISFMRQTGARPLIHEELPLGQVRDGLARIDRGDVIGKIVLTV
jgi:NADPH:quinone reductase-like Zn-dependent oxidoreductase